jgi:hypothetical protein
VTISGYRRPEHLVTTLKDVPADQFGVHAVRFGPGSQSFPGREVGALRGTSLRTLDLEGTGASDAALYHLAAMRQLSHLRLTGLALTPEGFSRLAGLDTLETLDLDDTAADDALAAILAKLKNLQVLNLDGTQITDEGIRHLSQSAKLITLSVRRTDVTAAGVEAFQSLRPECQIQR